ncbi:MAG TPA: DUF4249 domain-containing protein [Puia sp.]|nr:DUF4249 domain-containing protein [Puia sp.]
MKRLIHMLLIFVTVVLGGLDCKQVYTPPAIKNNPLLLVVDGIVISGNDSSIITLSRTRNLADTVPSAKEINAKVSVLSISGVEYPFTEEGNGRYAVDQLALDPGQQYQLKVVTIDGNEFRSALSNVLISPPIDSLYWNQDSAFNAHVYLNTHDATNQTKYYRWQYVETWEYHSDFNSVLDYNNGNPIARPLSNQIYRCYKSVPSSSIEVVSTTQLSSSVVNKYEIVQIPQTSEKISETYSNLVSQYAIPVEAYNFWSNLKRNTEQLGSLFDLQPFTELGNITCVNNPSISCIGFISFSTVQTQRIFISKNEVVNWNYFPYYGLDCIIDTIPSQDIDKYFQPPGGPYSNSLIGTAMGPYLLSSILCVDCTYHGGSTVKPTYWP